MNRCVLSQKANYQGVICLLGVLSKCNQNNILATPRNDSQYSSDLCPEFRRAQKAWQAWLLLDPNTFSEGGWAYV